MNKSFDKKVLKRFGSVEKLLYLCNRFSNGKTRAFSSAGLEHLPYKQRVGGSNPSASTKGCTNYICTTFLCFDIPI